MASIAQDWGQMIASACHLSSVPPEFLAALIANETGGDPAKTRFEPGVFARLQYAHPDWTYARTRDNATSWGLTQIMGENYPGPPAMLADPATNLTCSCRLLSQFAEHFGLDLTKDFESLFRCWNGGHPTAETYDPAYVPNGLARMELYPTGGALA